MVRQSALIREFPVQWVFGWLLIPHLIIIAMLPIGGPPMSWLLVVSMPLALIFSQLPWHKARAIGAVTVFLAVSIIYSTLSFNLSLTSVLDLPRAAQDVRPLRSPEYLIAAILLTAGLLGAAFYAPRAPRFRSPIGWMYAALLGILLLTTEAYAASATRGSYKREPEAGQPFQSASELNGLFSRSGQKRHLVVILVESLGVPVGGEEKSLFAADWYRPEWRERFSMSTGNVPYYGSTTNGELRELCNRWGEIDSFNFAREDCLPHRLKRQGYETHAYHSFSQYMFDRNAWYPQVGFDNITFREQLLENNASNCGGVFPGVCDTAIAPLVGNVLKNADQPQFVYWLTLNSHLPVLPEPSLQTAQCEMGKKQWREDNPQLCRLFKIHHLLAESIDALITDPALPPTDILIVGDHVPPFFDRASRLRFDGRHVPWIMLEWKDPNTLTP